MAWTDLKAAVAAVVKTNGTQAITGVVLQSTLNSIIDQVGANATFKGVATPATIPGTPDGPLFYIAYEKGIYANFNAINITEEDGLVIILYSSNWSKINIPLASKDELVQIETDLNLVDKRINEWYGVVGTPINVNYTTKKISIPSARYYAYKDEIGSHPILAAELDFVQNSMNNIFYDKVSQSYVNLTTLELNGCVPDDYLFVAVIPDVDTVQPVSNCPISYNGIVVNKHNDNKFVTLAVNSTELITFQGDNIILPNNSILVFNDKRVQLTGVTTIQTNTDFGYVVYNRTTGLFNVKTGNYNNNYNEHIIFIFRKINGVFQIYGLPSKADTENIENVAAKSVVSISNIKSPIIINTRTRTINFGKYIAINYIGKYYYISMDDDYILDYNLTGYSIRYIYLRPTMLNSAVTNRTLNGLFRVTNNINNTINGECLVATIPDSAWQNNVKPYTSFDYISERERDRTAVFSTHFETHTPAVKSLSPNDVNRLLDATAYDQFQLFISIIDDLAVNANKFYPYIQKCWIDGTAYDETNKCMTTAPTIGDHNIRNDMNQYPLIMYKFRPRSYTGGTTTKSVRKKILLVSGIHGGSDGGDHWESPVALYYVIKKIVDEFYLSSYFSHIRNDIEIDFIPCANPWGLNNKQRVCGSGIDINRDFGTYTTNESIFLKNVVDLGGYVWGLDSHCLGGTSLISGDLTGPNYYGLARDGISYNIVEHLNNYMSNRYLVKTEEMYLVDTTFAMYMAKNGIPLATSTEICANYSRFDGDTVGDVHSAEVVKRGVEYIQNLISIVIETVLEINWI